MAHIAHQPGPLCLEGGVAEPLAGRGGGFGGRSCTSAHTRRVGRFFNSTGVLKRAVPRALRAGPGPEGLAGMVGLCQYSPGGPEGGKAVAFHNPQAFSDVQEENHSCARDQVVIARPLVLTPPWRYRRSLVSKGRFTISINVICVGIRSSLPKRRYRVVTDYVGKPLRLRGKAGCWLFRGLHDTCVNLGKHRVVCGFSWLLRVIDHEAVLVDPKLFSSWVHRSVVLLKRGFGRQTSSRWRFSQKK
jgi:hypothetical protein